MVKNLPAMQEIQVGSLSQEDLLEKEMATHSSILAWRIPWTEEPGRPQPMVHVELDATERLNLLTCVRLFATPWTVAHQAPLSMKFSRQEYWTGLSFSSPRDLPDPGLLHCRQILYGLSHPVMLKFKPESREPLSSPPTHLFSASPTPLLVEKEG